MKSLNVREDYCKYSYFLSVNGEEWVGGWIQFHLVWVDCVKTNHTPTLDSTALNNSSLWSSSLCLTERKSLLCVLWIRELRELLPKERVTAILLRFGALSLQARGYGHLLSTMMACIPLHNTTRVIFFLLRIKMRTSVWPIFRYVFIWFHTESQLAL